MREARRVQLDLDVAAQADYTLDSEERYQLGAATSTDM
jgi:hypothetical protein